MDMRTKTSEQTDIRTGRETDGQTYRPTSSTVKQRHTKVARLADIYTTRQTGTEN